MLGASWRKHASFLGAIVISFASTLPVAAAPPVLKENKKFSAPIIKEVDTPAGKFNRQIVGLSPIEAAKLIRKYSRQHPHKSKAAVGERSKKRAAFWESRRKYINVAGRHFIPGVGIDGDLAAKADVAADTNEEIVIIVQFERESSPEETIAMVELGLTYLGQAGHSAIFAKLPLKSVKKLARFEFIRWVGEYTGGYKYTSSSPKNRGA